MNSRLLIDQIMQQTTVLIAQLSTAAGIRAPLSHIADQVFLDLSHSIESQGVSRKVAADMFGLALRTYQRRVQAITESASMRDRTLWEAIFEYMSEETGRSRVDVLHRFRWDEEASVKAVIHDLLSSGLIYALGKGDHILYKVTPEADLQTLADIGEDEHLSALIWVYIYRNDTVNLSELAKALRQDECRVQKHLDTLLNEGKLTQKDEYYQAKTCSISVGDKQGWEAAVYDHFQAMAKAVANKLNQYGANSNYSDHIGGATLSFDLYPGHPYEDDVLSLLQRYRANINQLWAQVAEHNQTQTQTEIQAQQAFKVTFYMGQNVEQTVEQIVEQSEATLKSTDAKKTTDD